MIPDDFEYYRPTSIREAVQLDQTLRKQGKMPAYYSGGTEIITLTRINMFVTDAVIDIKGIPECNTFTEHNGAVVIGAAVPLTRLTDSSLFPLLGQTAGVIADHTARNKITVGGNISGQIFYREAVLPFLLADSLVVIAGPSGIRQVSIHQVFAGELQLDPGEFLVQLVTDQTYVRAPFRSIKKRRQGKTGYPLVTVAALKEGGRIRTAFSGLREFPFRSFDMEKLLNDRNLPPVERIEEAVRLLPKPFLHDVQGSAEYREFVLKQTLLVILEEMEG